MEHDPKNHQAKTGDTIELLQDDGTFIFIHVNIKGLSVQTNADKTRIVTYHDGTYCHVRTIKITPEEERFNSRGIGSEQIDCFVCGQECKHISANISAFVESKEAGERIVKMFEYGAILDYRTHEPNWIQVKIGACKQHVICLQLLHHTVQDGFINKNRIKLATGTKNAE